MEFICPLLSLVGLYFAFGCGYKMTAVFGGTIWGIEVPMSAKQKAWKNKNTILFIVGLVVFLITCGPGMGALLVSLFSGFLGVIYVFVCVVAVPLVIIISVKRAVKEISQGAITANDTNAFVLGELPLIQKVESQLDRTNAFVVTCDGIGLIDVRNYCFETELYNDYHLGTLTSAKEVALIGMYFVQKYHNEFHYKVDFERTYYPGQTVTFIGTGGIYVGKTRSTMNSKFKSYIFYRN